MSTVVAHAIGTIGTGHDRDKMLIRLDATALTITVLVLR